MYKFVGVFIFCALLLSSASAQVQEPKPAFYKSIFLELGGNGLLFSGNYDMRLQRGSRDGLGLRLGLGGGRIINDSYLTFPLGINYLAGKRRSSVEIGLGITPARFRSSSYYNGTINKKNTWDTLVFMNLGYRFQSLYDGPMFRIDWTPALSSSRLVRGYAGFSLGLAFK